MKNTRKIISVLLSILMIMTSVPLMAVTSFAEDIHISGDYEYKILEDGTAEITKYNGNAEQVVLPSEIDGYKISVIGEFAFWMNETIRTVEISNGLIWIKPAAFELCKNLTEVKLPETIKYIGDEVFSHCISLKKINLPENLPYIAEGLFYGCKSLEEITLPKHIKEICSYAFERCESLKSVEIPYGTTRIEGWAFEYCESLESVIIPESVIWIETEAFAYCDSLRSVVVPENTSSLSENCFDRITIYGIKGSAAEIYAKNFECNFVAVDSTHHFGEWILDLDSNLHRVRQKAQRVWMRRKRRGDC